MAVLLAPYTNAMRLGQGFNSYTQQICVDDAVIIDPSRAENVLTNDGATMRIMAATAGRPSAWNRLPEVVNEGSLGLKAISAAEDMNSHEDQPTGSSPPVESSSADPTNAAGLITSGPDKATSTIGDGPSDNTSSDSTPEAIESMEKGEGDVPVAAETSDSKTIEESEDIVKEDVSLDVQESSNDSESAVLVDDDDPEPGETEASSTDQVGTVEEVEGETAESTPIESVDETPSVTTKSITKETLAENSVTNKARPRSSSTGNKTILDPSQIPTKAAPAQLQVKEIPTRVSKETPVPETKPVETKPVAPKPAVTRSSPPRDKNEFEIRQADLDRKEKLEMMKIEKDRMAELRDHQRKLELEARTDDLKRQSEDREEQRQIRQEKREYDAARRAAAQKSIAEAVAANKEPLTLKELESIRAQNQFVDRFDGIDTSDQKYNFDASAARGPSQTVTYSSRFVDKLTDVTDDMMISGALTVKMAKIGGSGRGSFVNSDKFKESDLNFYISVKVTNQTSNFKDALVYNEMRSVDIGSDNFNKVYGDTFISGFQEGGEFNAIISMNIHNKNKLTDIKAEAKVALTAGPVDIEATANVGIARTNVEMNTETTIQVSWCGGGFIKPMEQPWNIQSVMQAAARFPQLVADAPQRTYAILTKYDSLRSFVSRQPAAYSPIQYENAQIYTNVLMEAFLSYKSLYKKLGDQVSSIQNRTLEFEQLAITANWPTLKDSPSTSVAQVTTFNKTAENKYAAALAAANDKSPFDASIAGISLARKFIRRQMVYIVNEVDRIEKDPKLATDEDHEEPFQSPTLFESRVPAMKVPEDLKPKSNPLGGKLIMAKTQTEDDLKREREEQDKLESESGNPSLYQFGQEFSSDETASFNSVQKRFPLIGKHLQVSNAVPKIEKADIEKQKTDKEKAEKDEPEKVNVKVERGSFFNNLEFLVPDWQVESITVGMTKKGSVGSVEVVYENGLILRKGLPAAHLTLKTLSNFQSGERITSAAIETGTEVPAAGSTAVDVVDEPRVLSVCMYTNRGRRLLGQAIKNEVLKNGHVMKEGLEYKNVNTLYLDSSYSTGTFKGFFGRVSIDPNTGGIWRLGLIWGDLTTVKQSTASEQSGGTCLSTTIASAAPIYDIDTASSEALIDSMRSERDQAKKEAEALAMAREERDITNNAMKQAQSEAVMAMEQLKTNMRNELALSTQNVENEKNQIRKEMEDRFTKDLENAKQIKVNGIPTGRQSISFRDEKFRVHPSGIPFITFDNGVFFTYYPNGNLVVWSSPSSYVWNAGETVSEVAGDMVFHGSNDGNLVAWKTSDGAVWTSRTQDCKNGTLVFSSEAPYIEIFTESGNCRWRKP